MYICKFCGKETPSYSGNCNHEIHCKLNPNRKIHDKSKSLMNIPNIQYCKFCGKECKNLNSLKQHECRCKDNPNRKNYDNLSKYIINNRKGKTKTNCPEIAKQVETMKQKYRDGYAHPDTGWGFGFKCGWYKNIWCDSSWELAFLLYCLDNNYNISRNHDAFIYKLKDNTLHTYYPDFKIENIYYEIKGRVDDICLIKIDAVRKLGKEIILIDDTTIEKYLDYAIDKYGKSFIELYDCDKPSWRDYK